VCTAPKRQTKPCAPTVSPACAESSAAVHCEERDFDDVLAEILAEVDINELLGGDEDETKRTVQEVSGLYKDNIVKGVDFEKPESIVATIKKPHATLAASRSCSDRIVRLKCLRQVMNNGDSSTPCVFDVGSGSSGLRKALRLRNEVVGADKVFWHCSFPIAGPQDLTRRTTLAAREKGVSISDWINWVDQTGVIRLDRINACSHKAAECTCMKRYSYLSVMSVHSCYYFSQADWDNIFNHTTTMQTVVHIPEETGVAVPTYAPEFRWDSCRSWAALQSIGLSNWSLIMTKGFLLNQEPIVFEPVNTHGTRYYHSDPRILYQSGGFHAVPGYSFVEQATSSWTGLATLIAGTVAATKLAGTALRRFGVPMPKCVAAAAAVGLFAYIRHSRHCVEPGYGTDYTVHVQPGTSFEHKGEQLSQTYLMIKTQPAPLEPRMTHSYFVNEAIEQEVMSNLMLASGKTDDKFDMAVRSAKATALRRGCTAPVAKAIVERCIGSVDYLNCQGPSSKPMRSTQGLGASLCAYAHTGRAITKQARKLTFMRQLELLLVTPALLATLASVSLIGPKQTLTLWLNSGRLMSLMITNYVDQPLLGGRLQKALLWLIAHLMYLAPCWTDILKNRSIRLLVLTWSSCSRRLMSYSAHITTLTA
jgi:hypothetical protein